MRRMRDCYLFTLLLVIGFTSLLKAEFLADNIVQTLQRLLKTKNSVDNNHDMAALFKVHFEVFGIVQGLQKHIIKKKTNINN